MTVIPIVIYDVADNLTDSKVDNSNRYSVVIEILSISFKYRSI